MRPVALLVRIAPALAIGLLLVPVAGGLLGVALPAFGWLPALGGEQFGLTAWERLLTTPGLGRMVAISYASGVATALVALLVVVLYLAAFTGTRLYAAVRRAVSPILAVPHAAAAFGLAFLIAPSGLLARLFSPWVTGWERPPDLLIVNDAWGLTMMAGLVVKEIPFLLLMALAALPQCHAPERLAVARTLGYRPVAAWLKTVLPARYPLIRLPVYAVIAYASSVVDVALILGPSTPPPLSVAVVRWLNDPELDLRFVASAGALLQLAVTLAALASWYLGERLVVALARGWLASGRRGVCDRLLGALGLAGAGTAVGLAAAGLLGLAVWSVAGFWRFPEALPQDFTLRTWLRAGDGIPEPLANAALIGTVATLTALVLVLAALEHEVRSGRPVGRQAQAVLYLPLLVPQVAFLFGLVLVQARMGVRPGLWPVILGHLVFVFPYVYLSLVEAYRRLDPRWAQLALSLGASPDRAFLAVRLPLLLAPCLTAAAVGFAVSIGQYLPTQLLGAGR
ncbi:MAG: ABC transporter permease subunit, partial [Candidatus Competibacterales bacterium]|nr:ABC transporter permease subunit [Candidatus Competibacterales bacterium]